MKFFIDGTQLEEIQQLTGLGVVEGITTNPTLIARSGKDFKETIRALCALTQGPVSAEVAAVTAEDMIQEGLTLAGISDNVCVKLPLTYEGLKACYHLSSEGVMTNVTLCFSPGQALMAAKAGATFVSPFVGRLDDISDSGMDLIRQIVAMYANYPALSTQVLVASIRSPRHIVDAALAGADVVTAPAAVIRQLISHPLTTSGLEAFLKDWKSTGQKI